MEKITNKMYFEELLEIAVKEDREDLVAFITKEIAKLDKKAEYNKTHSKKGESKTAKLNKDLAAELYETMIEETTYRAKDFIEQYGSTQKVVSLMKILIECGKVRKITDKKLTCYIKNEIVKED